jgi:hypothetical protein
VDVENVEEVLVLMYVSRVQSVTLRVPDHRFPLDHPCQVVPSSESRRGMKVGWGR